MRQLIAGHKDRRGPSSQLFHQKALNLILILVPISTALWWVNDGWRGTDFTSSAVFFGADQTCPGESRGVGFHCFGDYGELLNLAQIGNPWNGETAKSTYPAVSILLYKPFVLISDLFGYRVSLAVFLFSLLVAASIPFWYLTRQFERKHWPALFFLVGPLAIPFLATFDRGQSVAWLAPIILWFLVSVRNNHMNHAVVAACFASVVRPHLALIGLIFLITRDWKKFVQFVVFGLALQAFGWLFYWREAIDAIPVNIQAIVGYNSFKVDDQLLYPPQITVWRGLQTIVRWTKLDTTSFPEVLEMVGRVLGVALFVGIAVFAGVMRKHLSRLSVATALVICATLFPGTTFVYYLAAFMPILALFVVEQIALSREEVNFDSRFLSGMKLIVMVISLVPVPIGTVVPQDTLPLVAVTSHNLAGLVWLSFVIAMLYFEVDSHKDIARRQLGLSR